MYFVNLLYINIIGFNPIHDDACMLVYLENNDDIEPPDDEFIGEVFEMRQPRKLDPFSMLEPSPDIKSERIPKCPYYSLNITNKPFWNLICIAKHET